MKKLIGISGKMGSGKDYLANLLSKEFPKTTIIRYADGLKDEVNMLVSHIVSGISDELTSEYIYTLILDSLSECSYSEFNYVYKRIKENIELYKGKELNSHNLRWVYQYWGTEVRRKQDNSYWLKKLKYTFDKIEDDTVVIVPDVRFENEADYIRNLGGIRVDLFVPIEERLARLKKRDGFIPSKEKLYHESEIGLDNYDQFDVTIIGNMFTDEQAVEIIKESLKNKYR